MSTCIDITCCEEDFWTYTVTGPGTGNVLAPNASQSYTATCPQGLSGDPVTVTVEAGSFDSPLSQSEANAIALACATIEAEAQIVCTAGGQQN